MNEHKTNEYVPWVSRVLMDLFLTLSVRLLVIFISFLYIGISLCKITCFLRISGLFLTGDSGYQLEPFLMTPMSTVATTAETTYNIAHAKTRVVIERTFGLLKSRFRCLDKSGGTLLYTPEKTCQLVIATAVLHNFCIARRISVNVDASVVSRSDDIQPPTAIASLNQTAPVGSSAIQIRRQIIRSNFER